MKQKSSTILPKIPTAVAPLHEVAKEGFPFRNLVDQAPVAICVFRGADFVLEVVNERFLHLLGKTKEQVINMPVFTALPVLFGQGYEELLAGVYKTGIACNVNESPTTFKRNGIEEVI